MASEEMENDYHDYQWALDDNYELCEQCGGDGVILVAPDEEGPCPLCDGTGAVHPLANETYKRDESEIADLERQMDENWRQQKAIYDECDRQLAPLEREYHTLQIALDKLLSKQEGRAGR